MAPHQTSYPWTPHKRLLFAREFIRDVGDIAFLKDADYKEVIEGLVVRHGKTFKIHPTVEDLRKEKDRIRVTHSFLVRHLLRKVAPEKFNPETFSLELSDEEWDILKKKKTPDAYRSSFKRVREGHCNQAMKIFHNYFGGFLEGTVNVEIDVDLQDDSEDEEEIVNEMKPETADPQLQRKKENQQQAQPNYVETESQSTSATNTKPFEPLEQQAQKITDRIAIIQKPQSESLESTPPDAAYTPVSSVHSVLATASTTPTPQDKASTPSQSSLSVKASTSSTFSNDSKVSPGSERSGSEEKAASDKPYATKALFKIDLPISKPAVDLSFRVYDGITKTMTKSNNSTPPTKTPLPVQLSSEEPASKKRRNSPVSNANVGVNGEVVFTNTTNSSNGGVTDITKPPMIKASSNDLTRVFINPRSPSPFEVLWHRVDELRANGTTLPSGFSVNEKLLDFISIDLDQQHIDALSGKVCLDDIRYLKVLEKTVRELNFS